MKGCCCGFVNTSINYLFDTIPFKKWTLICLPLSVSWISLMTCFWRWKWQYVTSKIRSCKHCGFLLGSLSWVTCSEESYVPHHEVIQKPVKKPAARNGGLLRIAMRMSHLESECYSPSQTFRWQQTLRTSWMQTHERGWAGATQITHSWFSIPRNCEVMNVCGSSLLNFGGDLYCSDRWLIQVL